MLLLIIHFNFSQNYFLLQAICTHFIVYLKIQFLKNLISCICELNSILLYEPKNIYIIIFSTHCDYYHLFNNFFKFNILKRYHLLHTSFGSIWCAAGKRLNDYFLVNFHYYKIFSNFIFCKTQMQNSKVASSDFATLLIWIIVKRACLSRFERVRVGWSKFKQDGAHLSTLEQIWATVSRLKQVRAGWSRLKEVHVEYAYNERALSFASITNPWSFALR